MGISRKRLGRESTLAPVMRQNVVAIVVLFYCVFIIGIIIPLVSFVPPYFSRFTFLASCLIFSGSVTVVTVTVSLVELGLLPVIYSSSVAFIYSFLCFILLLDYLALLACSCLPGSCIHSLVPLHAGNTLSPLPPLIAPSLHLYIYTPFTLRVLLLQPHPLSPLFDSAPGVRTYTSPGPLLFTQVYFTLPWPTLVYPRQSNRNRKTSPQIILDHIILDQIRPDQINSQSLHALYYKLQ